MSDSPYAVEVTATPATAESSTSPSAEDDECSPPTTPISPGTSSATPTPVTGGTVTISQQQYKRPTLKVLKTPKGPFEVPPRYTYVKVIGHGGYGVVIEAIDNETGEHVAIKQITDIFSKEKEYQKRILREVKIMKHFYKYKHDNIIELFDLICPRSYKEFKDVYIVMELMSSDLRMLIRSNQELADHDVQYFIYNMLKGLQFIHSAGILHRDIKPSNILINNDFKVKICDFGLSRGVDFEDPKQSTTYLATRWYRAPELLMKWEKSSKGIDVWSLGCIFAELLLKPPRKPLLPGNSYLNQLDLILDLVGTPPRNSDIKGSPQAQKYLRSQPLKIKKDLHSMFPGANPLAIDLLNKMLTFDPIKRVTVDDALKHPFLKELYEEDLQTEPELEDAQSCKEQFENEENPYGEDVDVEEAGNVESSTTTQTQKKKSLKRLLYEEIMEWNMERNNLAGDAIVITDESIFDADE